VVIQTAAGARSVYGRGISTTADQTGANSHTADLKPAQLELLRLRLRGVG